MATVIDLTKHSMHNKITNSHEYGTKICREENWVKRVGIIWERVGIERSVLIIYVYEIMEKQV